MKRITSNFLGMSLLLALALGATSCATYHRTIVVEEAAIPAAKNDGMVMAAERHFHTGVKFYNKGQYKKAAKHFKKSINKNPRNWDARYHLGICQRQLHHYSKATNQLKLALKFSPAKSTIRSYIHVELGLSWEGRGDYSRAADNYALAIEHDSRNDRAKRGSVRAHAHLNKDKSNKGKGKNKNHKG